MTPKFSARLLAGLTALAALLVAAPAALAGTTGGQDRLPGPGLEYATIQDGNKLLMFDENDERVFQITVDGVPLADDIIGIDIRPTDGSNSGRAGTLYGVGRSGGIYRISRRNGAAVRGAQMNVLPQGDSFGFDFNPTVDRLRITSDTNQNLRVNVDSGATIVDTPIQYASGDPNAGKDPDATGDGYTFAPFSATSPPDVPTVLFDIDTRADFLTTQSPANAGTLNSRGSLGRNARPTIGFDIAGRDGFAAFALLHRDGFAKLYRVRLANGQTEYKRILLRGDDFDGLAVLNGYGGLRG